MVQLGVLVPAASNQAKVVAGCIFDSQWQSPGTAGRPEAATRSNTRTGSFGPARPGAIDDAHHHDRRTDRSTFPLTRAPGPAGNWLLLSPRRKLE